MEIYEIFHGNSLLIEGKYKFLVVSTTRLEKDVIILYGDIKTRHFTLLHSWMRDNGLNEACTFGGGKMSILRNEQIFVLHLFGGSGDYGFSSNKMVQKIFDRLSINEIHLETELSTDDLIPLPISLINIDTPQS